MKFSVSSGKSRNPSKLNTLTLEKVIAWIDKKESDEPVRRELKKMVSVYPQPALDNWMKNYQTHLAKARQAVSHKQRIEIVELGEEPIEMPESTEIGRAPSFDEF